MSNLTPAAITLDKGLDLQTPKPVAEAGSILDTLNYEQVDFQGQKRIDGYTRYDGTLLAALDEYYVINSGEGINVAVGTLIDTEKGLLGLVVGNNLGAIHVAILNEKFIPKVNDDIFTFVNGERQDTYSVSSITKGKDSGITPEQHYTNLLAYNSILRSNVEDLPGGIVGLHWFRDRLYAVADVVTLYTDLPLTTLRPRDTVTNGSSSAEVLDVRIVYEDEEPVGTLVYLNSVDLDPWRDYTGPVFRNGVDVATAIISPIYDYSDEIASFFESRTEQQTLAEDGPDGPYDFGWRFVHLGWEVRFEKGNSLYGELVALNQNKQNVGVQGPTSIEDQSGSPTALYQKVEVVGQPTQINGWKSSETPTSYNLDPNDISVGDSNYTYADAYIIWDGSTGEVQTPGSTMFGLEEYPATNSVVVTNVT